MRFLKDNVKVLLSIILFLSFFTFYYSLVKEYRSISSEDYYFSVKNIKDNKWATFKKLGKGKFFIHPGEKHPVIVTFVFKNRGNVLINFSIDKNSHGGNIKFIVEKNNDKIDTFIIDKKNSKNLNLYVDIADKVKIIADKNGNTDYDWGNIKIVIKDAFMTIKKFVILFLWILFWIFLWRNNYFFIALNSFLLFILLSIADRITFGYLTFSNIVLYSIFSFCLAFIFVFFYQNIKKLSFIISFLLSCLIIFLALFFIVYYFEFSALVNKNILFAVFQTNVKESYEYLYHFISFKYIVLFVFVFILVGTILFFQYKERFLKIENLFLIFCVTSFSIVLIAFFSNLRVFALFLESFLQYKKEIAIFEKTKKAREVDINSFKAKKSEKGETYIVVIGESLNRKHMSLYNYFRETTPLLSKMKDQLIVFDNTYSCDTSTVNVLKRALTQANQYNKKHYLTSISIIELLKKAGFKTYWITNQALYGIWNNVVSVIATSSDHLIALNKGVGFSIKSENYDGAVLKEIEKILERKSNRNKVIFIHLLGSHTAYKNRYPKNFEFFKGNLSRGFFGNSVFKNKNINYYDNSVLYNDFVVSSILKEFQKSRNKVKGFIYFSDHSEDVDRDLGHNAGKFTYEMTQIPLVMWFSEGYKEKYFQKYQNLLKHTHFLFSNDMLYDTLVGIFGVDTDKYSSIYDLSSNDYSLRPSKALIFGRSYTKEDNYIYWQKVNSKYLIDTNQSLRVFPHRVDSIGKLNDIKRDGFNSFELDVMFYDKNESFIVNHNWQDEGIGLREFLSKANEIGKIWIDFKNLNENNYKKALERLEKLNKLFGIKDKTILESGTKGEFFKEFRDKGWHTSYYLPTKLILDFLTKKDSKRLEELAKKISHQIKFQNVSAISFDKRLYPFVKTYLEPKISDKIVYHVWGAPPLKNKNFREQLLKNKIYKDKRVKTFLSVFKSLYNL